MLNVPKQLKYSIVESLKSIIFENEIISYEIGDFFSVTQCLIVINF